MSKVTLGQTAYSLYPLSNYTFNTKAPKHEKDASVSERLQRMKVKYEKEGPRRSVEGVLLVQQNNHPHVLLLQIGNAFFKLPGGRLRPGENEMDGLRRKLFNNLSQAMSHQQSNWEIGECIGVYWRPNFDTMFYPYVPPHITQPKECKKIFIVPMPERCTFSVPRNLKLLAVPLFEIYDNVVRYGPVISALPHVLSRFRLNMVHEPAPQAAGATTESAPVSQHNSLVVDFDED